MLTHTEKKKKKNMTIVRSIGQYIVEHTEDQRGFEDYLEDEMFLRDCRELLQMAEEMQAERESPLEESEYE